MRRSPRFRRSWRRSGSFGEPGHPVRVVSADLPAYQRLYETVLVRLPGVRGLNSTMVMKQAVSPRPFPDRPPRELTAEAA
jgi:hypothetical protein